MKDNNKNHLMNTLVYDALKSAGVKEEEARAAAFEAGNNDLRLIALEHAIDKLQSHSDESDANLRAYLIENANRNSRSNLTIILGAVAVGVTAGIGFLSMLTVALN